MKRKNIVCRELARLTLTVSHSALIQRENVGFDADTIGHNLGLARNSVSKELNQLCLDGEVIKIKSRPVLFLHRASCEAITGYRFNEHGLEVKNLAALLPQVITNHQAEDPFYHLIGYDKSLKSAVEKARAAVLYPGGLHILLTGPSGVGKTFFAELMHQFALSQNSTAKTPPFIYFNCAEYYHNPELLSSYLFGHQQGAFTGATNHKKGLIEQADGGFLLLDEIHRLSYEGQEKLFSILDKGEFRALGATDKISKINVRLICATTEDIDSTLLRTFLRRIQVSIALPALAKRSLEERAELVISFLQLESRKINRTIRIDHSMLRYLLEKPLDGNIGQLKSDIQFLCAQAWAAGMGQQNSPLLLDQRFVLERVNTQAQTRLLVDSLFDEKAYLDISPHHFSSLKQQLSRIQSNQDSDLFYAFLTREYVNLRNSNVPPHETLSMLRDKLKTIFDYGINDKNQLQPYSSKIEQRIALFIHCIEQILGFPLQENLITHLHKHLLTLLSYVQRGLIPHLYSSSLLIDHDKKEYENACYLSDKIEEIFHIHCPSTEVVYLYLFLKECRIWRKRKEKTPECGVILIAHGDTTATSMANYVNRILERDVMTAIDMPFEQSVHDTLELLIKQIKQQHIKRLILIVDIGSLVHFASVIHKLFAMDVLLLQNITMSALLEVGFDLTYETSEFAPLIELMEKKGIEYQLCNQQEKHTGQVLVISCITGMGTAVKIKKVLEESFGQLLGDNTRLLVVDYNEVRSLERLRAVIGNQERLVGIIGTFQPGLPDIPFIALEELFSEQGPELVLNLLNLDISTTDRHLTLERCVARFIGALSLESIINHISVLNPQRILQEMQSVYQQICSGLDIHPSGRVTLRFLIHCCCMLERIVLSRKPLQMPLDGQQKIHPQVLSVIKEAFLPIESSYALRLSDAEFFYIHELLHG